MLISTTNFPENKLNVALVGAGIEGHAGVILDTLSYFNNINVVAFFYLSYWEYYQKMPQH